LKVQGNSFKYSKVWREVEEENQFRHERGEKTGKKCLFVDRKRDPKNERNSWQNERALCGGRKMEALQRL